MVLECFLFCSHKQLLILPTLLFYQCSQCNTFISF